MSGGDWVGPASGRRSFMEHLPLSVPHCPSPLLALPANRCATWDVDYPHYPHWQPLLRPLQPRHFLMRSAAPLWWHLALLLSTSLAALGNLGQGNTEAVPIDTGPIPPDAPSLVPPQTSERPSRITAPLVGELEPRDDAPGPQSATTLVPDLHPPEEPAPESLPPDIAPVTEVKEPRLNHTATPTNHSEKVESEEEEPAPIEEFETWSKKKLEEQQANVIKPTLVIVKADGTGTVVEHPNSNGRKQNGNGDEQKQDKAPADSPPSSPDEPDTPSAEVAADVIALQATQRNYASRECGAKVFLTNPETQHSNAVLNEKERDEYLLNPCQTAGGKFFYVELCETVQPTRVDIANFELFSSGPKELLVHGSERYPSNDWALLGNWTAKDNRDIQTFQVKLSSKTYVKFLKVEQLSHHGNEHFCPISMIRLFGVSMVEEYEAEEAIVQGIPTHSTIPAPPPHIPTNAQDHPKPDHPDILSKAKETVSNLVNGVKKLLGGGDGGNLAGTAVNLSACPAPDQSKLSNLSESSRQFWYRKCLVSPPVDLSLCHYFAPTPILLNFTSDQGDATVVQSMETGIKMNYSEQSSVTGREEKRKHSHGHPLHGSGLPTSLRIRRYDTFLKVLHEIKTKALEQQMKAVTEKRKSEEAKKEEAAVSPPPSPPPPAARANDTLKTQPIIALPGGAMNPKETLLVKLNNRIRALEMNISLSSEYLSELSKRYLKTLDDIQRQYNRTMRNVNETKREAEVAVLELAEELGIVRAELAQLRESNLLFRQHQIYVQEHLWKNLGAILGGGMAATLLIVWFFFSPSKGDRKAVVENLTNELTLIRQEVNALKEMLKREAILPALGNGHAANGNGPTRVRRAPSIPIPDQISDEEEDETDEEMRGQRSASSLTSYPSEEEHPQRLLPVLAAPRSPERAVEGRVVKERAVAASPLDTSLPWSEEPRAAKKKRRGFPKFRSFRASLSHPSPEIKNDNLFRFLNSSPDKQLKSAH